MIARLLVAVGVVAASVGLTLYGISTATYTGVEQYHQIGTWLMVGGVLAAIVGAIAYKRNFAKG